MTPAKYAAYPGARWRAKVGTIVPTSVEKLARWWQFLWVVEQPKMKCPRVPGPLDRPQFQVEHAA